MQRLRIGFDVAHCMKSQAASGLFEYFDTASEEPPWWPTPGISP